MWYQKMQIQKDQIKMMIQIQLSEQHKKFAEGKGQYLEANEVTRQNIKKGSKERIQHRGVNEGAKSGVYKMPIQKDQIEMMKRIQNEMRNSLKEKVKDLKATKIRIEEENEKLQERILQLEAAESAHRANFQVVQVTNKNLLRLIKRQITEMEEELECLICFEVSDTAPIFKCSEDHLICGTCQPLLSVCPICRTKLAVTSHRGRTYIKRKKMLHGKFSDFRVQKCL